MQYPPLDDGLYLHRAPVFRHALSHPVTGASVHVSYALQLAANSESSDLHHHLKQAALHLDRIQTLTRSLQGLDQRPFSILEAVNTCILIAKNQSEHANILLETELGRAARLCGSQLLFEEALLCLIHNGIEAYQARKKPLVRLLLFQDHEQLVHLRVIDGGAGLPNTNNGNQFLLQDGFSTKADHSGLGLAFATRVISSHFNGKLSLQHAKTGGTVVSMVLPVQDGSQSDVP